MIDLANKKVGVTGAQGFIGKYLCKALESRKALVYKFEDKSILSNADLTTKYLEENSIEYVIHLAGYNGGIEFNRKYPADIFTINTILALNIISSCSRAKVKKLLSTITSCAYPNVNSNEPHVAINLHNGPPEENVACHGYAKRNIDIASRLYRKQYGLDAITACPNTVYGPGDRFDPERTKVMTSLIKKFVMAKQTDTKEVVCWGTGSPKREFIYVVDTAELLVQSLEKWEGESLLNISSGQELTIKDLSELIAEKVGYKGRIIWDTTRPDGAMRKAIDTTQMKQCFGEFNFTPLSIGIEETVKWHMENNV